MRDGLVQTYDVLAMPTSSRWGGMLIGAYVNERGTQYNLLDTIFSATDEGVLSLAAIRDAHGQPFDFQIVHLNQGASRLLKRPVDRADVAPARRRRQFAGLAGSRSNGCSTSSATAVAANSKSTAMTAA